MIYIILPIVRPNGLGVQIKGVERCQLWSSGQHTYKKNITVSSLIQWTLIQSYLFELNLFEIMYKNRLGYINLLKKDVILEVLKGFKN